MTHVPRRLAVALAASSALALSACGSNDDSDVQASGSTSPSTTTQTTDHGAMSHGSSTSSTGASPSSGHGASTDASGGKGADAGAMSSIRLGSATADDLRVEVAAMKEPMAFTVSEGGKMRKHPPAPGDNAHVMVLVSDAESRDRLPDAAVTAQITGPAGVAVHNGPLYPMIGMGVGLHYGDNMKLPATGRYAATIVVGPPQVGRHPDSAKRYEKPVKLRVPFEWTAP